MDDHTISQITNILADAPDFFVPVKDLWLQLQQEGSELDLEELQNFLIKDDRFEFIPDANQKESPEENAPELDLETLGSYNGPRVKLSSREMTAEDILEGMARSLTRMNQALQSAWEARPIDDQETEEQLLEILAAGQQLECEVQELISKQALSGSEQDI